MKYKQRIILGVLAVVLFASGMSAEEKQPSGTPVYVPMCSKPMMDELVENYTKAGDKPRFRILGIANNEITTELSKDACRIALHRGSFSVPDYHRLSKPFGGPKGLRSKVIGRYVVCIVVHAKNPVRQLSNEYLSKIFLGQIQDWGDVPGGAKGKPIHLFSPYYTGAAYQIVRANLLDGVDLDPKLKDWSAKPLRMKSSAAAVLHAVSQDRDAIGFCLYSMKQKWPEQLQILGLASPKHQEPILPSEDTIAEGVYPLYQELSVLLSPKATEAAYGLYGDLASSQSAGIIQKHMAYPESVRRNYLANKHLKQLKEGMGEKIEVVGCATEKKLTQDLVLEYVKMIEPLRMHYSSNGSPRAAISAFVNRKDAILILPQKIDKKSLQNCKDKWDKLCPTERVLGGRAVAVITHAENPITSLTQEQVRLIFTGKIRDWNELENPPSEGNKEETTKERKIEKPRKKEQKKKALKTKEIHCFGLVGTSPTGRMFSRLALAAMPTSRVQRKQTSAEVFSFVASDKQAIAFVDCADLPRPGCKAIAIEVIRNVAGNKSGTEPRKSLAKTATQPAGKSTPIPKNESKAHSTTKQAVPPIPQSISNGTYPYAEQIYLYIPQNAGVPVEKLLFFILKPDNTSEIMRKYAVIPSMK